MDKSLDVFEFGIFDLLIIWGCIAEALAKFYKK